MAAGMEATNTGFLQKDQEIAALGGSTAGRVNWFFEQLPGTVSEVVENDRGLWVASLVEKRPAGTMPLVELKGRIERLVRNRKKVDIAAARLEALRREVSGGIALAQAAKAAQLELRSPEAFARTESVSGIGRNNKVIAAAFDLGENQLSEVVAVAEGGYQGAYLMRVLEKMPEDEEKFAEEREQVAAQLHAERQQLAIQNWFAHIYETAEIEDNRHRFFTF